MRKTAIFVGIAISACVVMLGSFLGIAATDGNLIATHGITPAAIGAAPAAVTFAGLAAMPVPTTLGQVGVDTANHHAYVTVQVTTDTQGWAKVD